MSSQPYPPYQPQQPHQPGQQPYPPQQPGQPYGGQPNPHGPPQPGQPYPGQPQPGQPYPGQPRPMPDLREIGAFRNFFSSSVDAIITVLGGFLIAGALFLDESGLAYWLPTLGCLLGVSFVNHVLLTVPLTASVGKLLFNVRLLRVVDGGRPRFWQAVRRWLAGFVYVPSQWLLSHVGMDAGDDGEELCGLLKAIRPR